MPCEIPIKTINHLDDSELAHTKIVWPCRIQIIWSQKQKKNQKSIEKLENNG